MMSKAVVANLDVPSSVVLICELANQELSFDMVCSGTMEYEVHLDGVQTVHSLKLRPDGTWNMTTHLEV